MLGLGLRVRAGRRRLLRPLCRHKISIFDQGPEGIPHTEELDVQILGSSSKSPTPTASCPAVGVRVGSHHWIFDCGEGTQRQLLLSRMMKLKLLRGICITHMHGDHVLGLPGMVLNAMTLHSGARLPSIYGPEGLYNFLSVVLKLCEVRMSQNHQSGLTVHELLDCYEGEAPNMLPYHRRQPEFKLPNVHYKGIPRDPDGFWTIESNDKYVLRAGRIEHGVPTFGYVVSERARRGSLDVARVRAMGLEQGPIYRELAEGRDVTMPNGSVIRSAEVMSPSVPGRKVTILGDTCNPYAIAPLADDSDVLVHEATLESAQERVAVARGHSTPTMAATFAKHINARHLVLNHMSNRYRRMGPDLDSPFDEKVDEEGMEVQLVEEAEAVLGQGRVTAARDLLVLQLPRRAGGKAKVSGQKKKELLQQQRQEKQREQAEEAVAVASTAAAAAVEQPCPPPSSPAAADPCSPPEEKEEEEPSTVSRLLSLLRRSSSIRDSTSSSGSVASAAGEGGAGRGGATARTPRQSARAQAWP